MVNRNKLDPKGDRLVVSTCQWDADFGGKSGLKCDERADLRAQVSLVSGFEPSRAIIWAHRDPNAPGPIFPAVPGVLHSARVLPDYEGTTIAPFGLREWSHILISPAGKEDPVFLGLVTGWRWNRQAARIEIIAQDYRVLLHRIKCHGSYWYRVHVGGLPVWLPETGPWFNARGVPDEWIATDRQPTFCTPGYYDDAEHCAAPWRCGDALNCLRDLFTVRKPSDLDAADKFMDWPAAVEDLKWPGLFVDPDSGEPRVVSDLDCRGKPLGWAIDQVISAAGALDWTLTYDPKGKAAIKVYEITSAAGVGDGDFSLGRTGGAPQDDLPEVLDATLEMDWSECYNTVRAVGARKQIDLSLEITLASPNVAPNVDAASVLQPLWTADPQADWLALDPADPERNSQAYQDVFLAFGAPEDLDWTTWLGAAFRDGEREALPLLISEMFGAAAAGDRAVRVPFRIWRYKGSAWEPLPGAIGAQLLKDRVGFRLAAGARAELAREPGGDEETWSWYLDGSTPRLYPLRITLCVAADDRLVAERPESGAGQPKWPPGEFYIVAGERYQYQARRAAWLRADGGGNPVIDGGFDTEFGAAADDVVRDDTAELAALASRRQHQLGALRLRGSIDLWPMRFDIQPGFLVGALRDSGKGLALPEIQVLRAVRHVEHDDEAQITRLTFEEV